MSTGGVTARATMEPRNAPDVTGNDKHEGVTMADNPTIKQGSKGAAVKKAQKALKDRGYNPGAVDGIFGRQTKNAVLAYQRDRKDEPVAPLAVDGIIGPKTWARLDPPTIKKGSKGDAVKLLQHLLGHFGITVAVDGDFGANTEKAVKKFQELVDIDVDGIVGRVTWISLGS
jgi:peptidoglycan hydrolase-like protein with peptidoglycan-binding domain